eukprot:TRINITY_DN3853_c0_g1_i2.p1 TRINITY_DN3853_c0_g1~~TRINITY_DN3853_c0_g1_i2.p1  ORF type:complete len:211 (+),score=35.79 TRINITY_DN3853_c0_g1_i2:22-633(+)
MDSDTKFKTKPFKIQSGRYHGQRRDPEWNLLNGQGTRTLKKLIVFPFSFETTPMISIGFSLMDIVNQYEDYQIKCYAETVSSVGFTLCVETWGDSSVWSCDVSWVAVECKHGIGNICCGIYEGSENMSLCEGSGTRSYTRRIYFGNEFPDVPHVVTFISGMNVSLESDIILECSTREVTTEYFELEIQTRKESCVYGAWIMII